jgi:hypothetical protein
MLKLEKLVLVSGERASSLYHCRSGSIAVGSAVAILYAEWHNFAFSPPGIRHEHPRRLKANHHHSLVPSLSSPSVVVSFGLLLH